MIYTALDIERATIRAWPAAEQDERFGWVLLAAGGVTGRVNACWPLTWTGETALNTAIDAVESWYAARNLPPRFKVTTNAVAPLELTDALRARNYAPTHETLIMTRQLDAAFPAPDHVRIHAEPPPSMVAVLRETSADAAEFEERFAIAQRAPRPAAFAQIEQDGRAIAIGMSASADGLAGVFLMRTAPAARRKGCARAIVHALLHWAQAHEAGAAFLQVEADNPNAVALYAQCGFSEAARYAFWRPS
ncbi:MAG: GNAT family N-acetyltransferase [Alphaproteobacteria bacterium]|nr:GNAT family N-acetyltransferase [Alphaproteobacteria bacterium]